MLPKEWMFYLHTSAMAMHTIQIWWPKIPVLTGQMWNRSSRRNQSYLWDMPSTGTTGEIAPQDPKLCQFELWRCFLKCRDKTWAQELRLSQQQLFRNPLVWEIFSSLEDIKQGSADASQPFSISEGCLLRFLFSSSWPGKAPSLWENAQPTTPGVPGTWNQSSNTFEDWWIHNL